MWVKINGKPLESSKIKNISRLLKVTSEEINHWFNRHHSFSVPTGWGQDEKVGVQLGLVYEHAHKNSTGNLHNYPLLPDGKYDYKMENILPSTFEMDSDKYYFIVNLEGTSSGGHTFHDEIYSSVYDSLEEADSTHNNLLSKLNEIEMNVVNIEI